MASAEAGLWQEVAGTDITKAGKPPAGQAPQESFPGSSPQKAWKTDIPPKNAHKRQALRMMACL